MEPLGVVDKILTDDPDIRVLQDGFELLPELYFLGFFEVGVDGFFAEGSEQGDTDFACCVGKADGADPAALIGLEIDGELENHSSLQARSSLPKVSSDLVPGRLDIGLGSSDPFPGCFAVEEAFGPFEVVDCDTAESPFTQDRSWVNNWEKGDASQISSCKSLRSTPGGNTSRKLSSRFCDRRVI